MNTTMSATREALRNNERAIYFARFNSGSLASKRAWLVVIVTVGDAIERVGRKALAAAGVSGGDSAELVGCYAGARWDENEEAPAPRVVPLNEYPPPGKE